jgi:uncharacterized protein YndB with AHSA1/START domain
MTTSTVLTRPITVRTSRQFRVSAERLFDAWFQSACFASFLLAVVSAPLVRADFDRRIGGRFLVAARRNDATVELRGEYIEIDRPERLVFSLAGADAGCGHGCVTVELAALGRGCLLVLLHEMDLQGAPDRARVQLAWNAALSRLADMEPECAIGVPHWTNA